MAFGGSGEIVYMEKCGNRWITDGCFGRFVYSTYNAGDCVNNYYSYNRAFRQNQSWSEGDFSKPGVETAENLEHREYFFGAEQILVKENKIVILLRGNEDAVTRSMNKMGHKIYPLDVVKGGNRRQHCVEEINYNGADGKISVKNIHAPLVSVGGRWIYGDYRELPDIKKGFSYCLFNNKWGTNFKMWCENDCTFEFVICIDN